MLLVLYLKSNGENLRKINEKFLAIVQKMAGNILENRKRIISVSEK